eukprot:scaffold35342_cov112-Isochrysis_galbana.AAC.5
MSRTSCGRPSDGDAPVPRRRRVRKLSDVCAPFEIHVEFLRRRALIRFPHTRFDERWDELELILRLKKTSSMGSVLSTEHWLPQGYYLLRGAKQNRAATCWMSCSTCPAPIFSSISTTDAVAFTTPRRSLHSDSTTLRYLHWRAIASGGSEPGAV